MSKTLFASQVVIATFLAVAPFVAHAGLLSFVTGLFNQSADQSGTGAVVVNSQNMTLLKAALNSDPNPAKGGGDIAIVGGTALLPETGPSGTLADIEEHPQTTGTISIYVVRKGDSISGIAKMFGVSVNTIIWANDIRSSVISEGQTLVILPISGVRHIVKQNDTIESIAKKYKADIAEIRNFNDLDEDAKLALGETIIIPDGEIPISQRSYAVVGSGYYARPLKGGTKTQGIHGYNGVDIGAPVGTPVLASANGKVIISKDYGWNGGYGNYIVIAHDNGTQTLYSHLSENAVYSGWVTQGDVIGYVGSTGKSTGPHLHFEIRGAKNPF